jgi:hypothetical protein
MLSLSYCTVNLFSGHLQDCVPSLFFGGGGDWGLNSGVGTCKAGSLLLEPHLQCIFALMI